ncbi:MAG: outer membrane protein transport protein [Thiohalospira sp.]
MSGTITIDNFQWPTTIALGGAYTPNDKVMLAADLKMLQWSEVMEDFSMTFEPDADAMDGESADITLYQDWDDQLVISLGGAYKLNPKLTVRGGANLSSNPVPDKYVHPLFPATIENHYTAGVGYDVTSEGSVNFSLTHAPKVSVTNSKTQTDIDHAQTNWQLMYSQRF